MARVRRFVSLIVLIGLTLAFFYKLTFTDMILARGDTFSYFYPYWDVRDNALRAGQLPLWTPDIFMGAPLLANPQLGTFYPPNWLTMALDAPNAIRISILLHVLLASTGACVLFQKTMSEHPVSSSYKHFLPALLAGALYGLGGYAGAHVEQINQLQGLAWMPWLFWVYHRVLEIQVINASKIMRVSLLAIALALQIFSGHTQTVFISGVGLGIYGIIYTWINSNEHNYSRQILIGILLLIVSGVLALMLAIPQLIPTLELASLSNRHAGLDPQGATAFSLSPSYIGRGMLPSYDGQLFGEYVSYIGITGLALALLGAFSISTLRKVASGRTLTNSRIIWIIIALIGLSFALGRFNPIYTLLAELPGFNFFRVPARWLSLFALASALLGGMGLQSLQAGQHPSRRIFALIVSILGLIMLATRFLPELIPQAAVLPEDVTGPAIPTNTTFFAWCAALGVFVVAVYGIGYLSLNSRRGVTFLFVVTIAELFLASLVQPYHDLVPPDVYSGQRFTVSQMLAYNEGQTPPGRILSISGLLFDPGDKATLEARYKRADMDDLAIRHAFVATKKQETLFPNLSLTWGIPSVDGFDGGLLPTLWYTQFTSLLLPEGETPTVDGRLGEILAKPECRGACIPDDLWLRMTDARYLITDKVYDIWRDGIAYDTTFAANIQFREYVHWYLDGFVATVVDIIYEDNSATSQPRLVVTTTESGNNHDLEIPISNLKVTPLQDALVLGRYTLDQPFDITHLVLYTDSALSVRAITLVDTRTGDFFQLPADRILSSDIKLYHTAYGKRAYVANRVVILPDTNQASEDARDILADKGFHMIPSVTIHDALKNDWIEFAGSSQPPTFDEYEPTYIKIRANSETGGYLVLSDAYYPGWKATVNGQPVSIYRANIMFRAVPVPSGESTVIFTFEPDRWYIAIAFGVGLWVIVLIGMVILWRQGNQAK